MPAKKEYEVDERRLARLVRLRSAYPDGPLTVFIFERLNVENPHRVRTETIEVRKARSQTDSQFDDMLVLSGVYKEIQ